MKYAPDTHKRRSVRLKGYDYSQSGAYFVTICTRDKEPILGEIAQGIMHQNSLGKICQSCWEKIPDHNPYVQLDSFVIMPDHIHGIIFIDNDGRGTACRAPTEFEQFGKPVCGSLPTIIRSFKSAVTKQINLLRDTSGSPVWQRNYYEHIIRHETELNDIRQYITDNPANREKDENNPQILAGP